MNVANKGGSCMAKQIRRIVTGHNAAGKSIIAQDAFATSILELEAVPGLRATDLWETTTAPADLSSNADPVARPCTSHLHQQARSFESSSFPPMPPSANASIPARSLPPWARVMPLIRPVQPP